MPAVTEVDLGPSVRAGFTTREGGVSEGPWRGLNLASHVGDRPDHVAGNRALIRGWAGAQVQYLDQVHGREVLLLDGEVHEPPPACDGAVASGPTPVLAVLVADCVPVLLADPRAGVVGAAHAGRRGLADGVLEAVVAVMLSRGADPRRIRAALGPAAGGCCYEVPAAMRENVAERVPAAWATTRAGTPSLDLRAGAASVLAGLGIGAVLQVGGCTIDDPALYSYRRAPVTGRFAGLVRMLP